MAKGLTMLLLALALCGFISGCASKDGDSAQNANSGTGDLILLDSGWSATDGYVHYGLVLENTSDSLAVVSPAVVVIGYDEKGRILFTDSQTLETLLPPGVGYYGAAAGNGTIPDVVDFSLAVDEGSWRDAGGATTSLLSVGNVKEVNGVYGSTSYVGDLLTNTEWDDGCGAVVSVILRNGDDEIVYGANAFVDGLAASQTSDFEVNVVDAPTHSYYEIHALQQER